jgi:hypothetical protein
MPLTDYQQALALLLAENRTFDSYLAGGAAILIEPNTTRFSRDLDYFHDSEARVSEAFSVDQRLLLDRGYSVEVELSQPGYVRAIVRRGNDATKVEWARDSDWRFMPTVRRSGRICAHPSISPEQGSARAAHEPGDADTLPVSSRSRSAQGWRLRKDLA